MKKEILLSIFAICFIGLNISSAQGFEKPADGKAVIYFTRTVGFGSSQLIDIFDGGEYLTYMQGKGYWRYECDPGEHTIWIAAENTHWVSANVDAGEVYIAQIYVYPGVMKSRCKLVPQSNKDEELDGYNASIELIKEWKPMQIKEKSFNKRKDKFVKKEFMTEKLEGYQSGVKGSDGEEHLSDDMNVSESEM